MAKPLDSDKIESARRANSKAERREQKRRGLHQEIAHNRGGNGVIIIPPPKKESPLQDTKKLRVAAYCRVSTQEEQQLGSFEMQVSHYRKKAIPCGNWSKYIRMRGSAVLLSVNVLDFKR